MKIQSCSSMQCALFILLLVDIQTRANRAGKATKPKSPQYINTPTLSPKAEEELGRNRSLLATNVTFLLNNLLKDYDNSLRPGLGEQPLRVDINMQVRSMGPISEIDMSYSMDCYFRQSWVDKRLAFNGEKDLALSIEMLTKIWKPDTYIYNGRKSYLHTITTPNKFMRLSPHGKVLYSQRLTIKATCQMDLSDFPMDLQRCPLEIGSFGYTTQDVIYQWTSGRGVNIASDMKLSQFDLIATPTGNATLSLNKGRHSTLFVSFHLQRHMGNFVIQVYGPCILLVVISWVSFWLNREATSDRISLGVTTVLTMTFLGLEARTDLPQVAYPTALDYFVFLSFMFIFATVTQFALVHYFTKLGAGEYYLEELEETICNAESKRSDENFLLEQQYSSSTTGYNNEVARNTAYVGNHISANNFHSSDTKLFQIEKSDCIYSEDDEFYSSTQYAYNSNPIICNNYNDNTVKISNSKDSSVDFRSLDRKIRSKEMNFLNHHPYGRYYYFYNKKSGRAAAKKLTEFKTGNGGCHMGHAPSQAYWDEDATDFDDDEWENVPDEIPPPPSIFQPRLATSKTGFNSGYRRNGQKEQIDPVEQCGCKRCITRAMNNPEKALNSVSRIDKISRIVFPCTFLSLNMFYWYNYLKHSERIDLSFESS